MRLQRTGANSSSTLPRYAHAWRVRRPRRGVEREVMRARLREAVDGPLEAVVGGVAACAGARSGRGRRALRRLHERDVRVGDVALAAQHQRRGHEHEHHDPEREPRQRLHAAGRRDHPSHGRDRRGASRRCLRGAGSTAGGRRSGRRAARLSRWTILLDALRELPCGRRLLEAAAGVDGVHLVGGAVRDLLLGRAPRELDVVVEGEVDALAAALGDQAAVHERFGTVTVRDGACSWDLAAARAESYLHPGALPDVRPAAIGEDLERRDVTVNAIALDLRSGEAARRRARARRSRRGPAARPARRELPRRPDAAVADRALPGAAGLRARAAHGRARGGRRRGRLGRARVGRADRQRAAARARRARSRGGARERGRAWGSRRGCASTARRPPRRSDCCPTARAAPDLVVLAAAIAEDGDDADQRLAGLDFKATERAVVRAAVRAPEIAAAALAAERPSELARVLRGLPVEAVALAGAARRGRAGAALARRAAPRRAGHRRRRPARGRHPARAADRAPARGDARPAPRRRARRRSRRAARGGARRGLTAGVRPAAGRRAAACRSGGRARAPRRRGRTRGRGAPAGRAGRTPSPPGHLLRSRARALP